jgi:predicted transcriptional regulator
MAKNAVYSWRLSEERKAQLEELARQKDCPLAELLDEAVAQWLQRELTAVDDQEQHIRRKALRHIGSISGGDPERAAQARSRLREKLRTRRDQGA